MYKVEHGIPVVDHPRPQSHRPKGLSSCPVYPWRLMEVGDSFLISAEEIKAHPLHPVRGSANLAGKRLNCRFVTRTVPEGLRVWRVS